MDNGNIREIVQKIAEEIKLVILAVLQGQNLGDSELYQDLNVDVDDINLINITVNDYIKYIQSGREKGSGKGGFPPTEIIAEWCVSKGLNSDNEFVLNICRAIYWHGIKNDIPARPLFEKNEGEWKEKTSDSYPIAEAISAHWDEWAGMLYDAITENLDKEFKN